MKNPLTVYIPDEEGNLTTWLSSRELSELLDISQNTVLRWVRAGAVRARVIRNVNSISVLDAALLRFTKPKDSRELGIVRFSPEEAKRARDVFHEKQGHTLPAPSRYEIWDDYDVQALITRFEAGMTVEDIALNLGRTYAATVDRIELLRKSGDLPPAEHRQADLDKVVKLILPTERAKLERTVKS